MMMMMMMMMTIRPAPGRGSAALEEKSHSDPFLRQKTVFIPMAREVVYTIVNKQSLPAPTAALYVTMRYKDPCYADTPTFCFFTQPQYSISRSGSKTTISI